mmetsp:Transcript_3475/g.4867  ORF Transcript_3475/g.4867 Transcript_3475/m.4867 type:complete len:149 (+) Transcript_3475:103-549(+)|eukprot:CAMPEP_0197349862 /NCGR_PEP_ID=MMETSP0893-20130614/12824_1 /TAXON_ID=44058 ORGANISM="Aureoumbra lagunensis, Strain CCMP1510" /NCGR_SAMPLE_ID=MMETSP0893 /ASSEMBLY_ACC=CAM_ASM_000539 /LENGTH=148 /DNA_ID=CAMNT_0042861543 /DNA_START=87 /DNA_END=533 /DNA_ORIENTATION=+
MSNEAEIENAKRSFEKVFLVQIILTSVWMIYSVVIDPPTNTLVHVAVMANGVAAIVCGYYVTRVTKDKLSILYQLFALLCTTLCFTLLYVVGVPAAKQPNEGKVPSWQSNRAILGTTVALVFVLVAVRATKLAQNYGEAVIPLKKKDE